MVTKCIRLWFEGDIATNRIIARLFNDLGKDFRCESRLIEKVDWGSLVGVVNVFSRVCDPKYMWLPRYMRNRGIDYAYFIDDNFWKLIGDSELSRHYQSPPVVNALDEFVQNATVVIANSQILHDFIRDRFPDVQCVLVPPPFDIEITRHFLLDGRCNPVKSHPVVGYAGGYKQDEFRFVSEIICALSKERPDVRFEFIGGVPSNLNSNAAVQWFPGFPDYATYLAFKASRKWDVGLAPLFFSEFNASKTNNKFREYGGCGITGIYSDVLPYNNCVQSGVTGMVVKNNVDAWVEAIITLIDGAELREKIRGNAFDYVEMNYSHQAVGAEWIKALEGVSGFGTTTIAERFRFDCVKRFYLDKEPDIAKLMEFSDNWLVYKWRLKEWLNQRVVINARKFFYLFIALTLLNINLFLLGFFN